MNRNFLLAFNVFLLVLVGVLFYLHFASSPKAPAAAATKVMDNTTPTGPFKIAYFEMDSIENNYQYLKEVKNQLKAKENQLNGQLTALKNRYMEKVNKYQQEAQAMTQERQGALQQELMQEQKMIQNKEQAMGGDLQEESFKKMQIVNKKIEDYLKEFNRDKGYSYILAHQPGTIYYKDTTYDITTEMLKGLNDSYKKKD
jgi:outer membrane protein